LDFTVDFLGRGNFPPSALHSEGHQDSMGLCLFLALSERLSKSVLDLVILDDVVMSIDAHHRRAVCRLLSNACEGRQLLITTHDRTWAEQLRETKIVTRKNLISFLSWSIETGPVVSEEHDVWEKIRADLEGEDVAGAAHKLRLSSEQFFESVCDSLRAEVRYRSDARWQLGDWLRAVRQEYPQLIKKAKAAAQAWKNEPLFDELQAIDSKRAQVFQRAQIEQWPIDPNVHYSKWHSFTSADLTTVVDAFQDLFQLFRCGVCEQLLEKTFSGDDEASVKCLCGAVTWNLQVPKK
jgi:energy-coupling factor transporter ATP-binding protein EcfA2